MPGYIKLFYTRIIIEKSADRSKTIWSFYLYRWKIVKNIYEYITKRYVNEHLYVDILVTAGILIVSIV